MPGPPLSVSDSIGLGWSPASGVVKKLPRGFYWAAGVENHSFRYFYFLAQQGPTE